MPPWTAWTCFLRHFESEKSWLQSSHCFCLLRLSCTWTVDTWFWSCPTCLKAFRQTAQTKLRSSAWIKRWFSSLAAIGVLNSPQILHMKSPASILCLDHKCWEQLRHRLNVIELDSGHSGHLKPFCSMMWHFKWISRHSLLAKVALQPFREHLIDSSTF